MKTRLLAHPFLALLPLASGSALADTVSPGFRMASSVSLPIVGTVYATLRDGTYASFDGLSFELHARDGSLLSTLGTLFSFVYPSFATLDPSESFALFGESSNGDIYRVELSGAGFGIVAQLPFNYDAEFDLDPAFVWISAALGGFGQGNDFLRLELATGNSSHIAHLSGASGPFALDGLGDLYYGDVPYSACPDLGSTDVLRFARASLFSGQLLDESDASLFSAGYDGASSLGFEPTSGHLFLAEANFCYAVGRIREIGPSGARLATCIETPNFVSIVEFIDGAGPATFQPFQPQGTQLKYNSTDYNLFVSDILTVTPRRATAAIQGPSSGPGQVTLSITGGQPNAGVYVLFGSVNHYTQDEIVYDLGFGFPVFFALPANKIRRIPLPIPTDANGTATFSYYDPGYLHGTLVFQGLLIDAQGAPLGTSRPALN